MRVYRGKDERSDGGMSRRATNHLSQNTTWTAFRIPAEIRELFLFYSTQKSSWSNVTSSTGIKAAGAWCCSQTSTYYQCSCNYIPQYFLMASTGANLPLPLLFPSTINPLKQTKREKLGEEGGTVTS